MNFIHLDTGYDLGHVDLPKENVTGWNPDLNDTEYESFGVWNVDLYGHGTHVAGTIGAIGDNNGELSHRYRFFHELTQLVIFMFSCFIAFIDRFPPI